MRRIGILIGLVGAVLLAAWALGASGLTVHHIVCDEYNRAALMSSMSPGQTPYLITPPPGWREAGPGCWEGP